MKHPVLLRDPTAELSGTRRPRRTPPTSLQGVTVALLDIGKMRGAEFIDQLERQLQTRGIQTRRYRKPTNTKVAPADVIQRITLETQAAIIALSD